MPRSKAQAELEKHLGFELAEMGEGPEESELQALHDCAAMFASYTIPTPSQADTALFLEQLQDLRREDVQRNFREQMNRSIQPRGLLALLRLIVPQISIFTAPFWLVSVGTLILGSYFLPLYLGGGRLEPLLVLSPPVIAYGVSFAFQDFNNELESTAALGGPQLVLARMAIILGYNTLIGFPLVVMAHRSVPGLAVLPLVLSWLAPLTLWAGLALWLSLRFGSIFAGIGGIALWLLQLTLRDSLPSLYMFSLATTSFEVALRIMAVCMGLTLTLTALAAGTGRSPGRHGGG